MNDALKRGVRTFFQSALGVIALQGVALIADANDGVIDANLWQRAGMTAAASGFIAVVSWAQNALEDKDKIPTLLK